MVTTEKQTEQRSLMAHLMRRAGFGVTQRELDELEELDYDGVVDSILDPGQSNHLSDELVLRYHTEVHEQRAGPWSAKQWLYRMVTTETPIVEKIALFWHGIFATGYAKTNQARALSVQIDMFRRFGLGKFDDLLEELSKDPAMIIWLDNQDNHKGAINENFGREILELFSMGIGNYTEEDIKECSRAFTGWTLKNAEYMSVRAMKDSIWPYGRISWHYEYREHDHDTGEKTFLGETGNFNGDDIIGIISKQRAAAEFISRHLYDFFVADEVPVPQWPYTPARDPEAIQTLSEVYLSEGHDITEMLRVLFKSEFFKNSRFERVRCPAEYVAGCLRTSDVISRPTLLMNEAVNVMEYMGQSLLNPPSVEGWHEGKEWINSGSIVERVNFAYDVWQNSDSPEVKDITDRLASSTELDTEDVVDACLDFMGPLVFTEDNSRQAIIDHISKGGNIEFGNKSSAKRDVAEKRIAEILALIASSKEYQRG
ncbi:DUF1800 domain-containing protein [SAR202 cluster bacterium AD-802-K11_MRT_200m]|nr:DUF1800 domain-containing protein [SAR202 cluster bacterium AD-802-K11_MRT_200m]